MYALVRSDPYCSVRMGCVSLACNSASMSLNICLSYMSVETFGKVISVVKQLIAVVYLVKLVDVKNHL